MRSARRLMIAALAGLAVCVAVWLGWQAFLSSSHGRQALQVEMIDTPARALDWPTLLDAEALRVLPCGTALRLEHDNGRGQCLLVIAGGKLVLVQAGEGAAAGLVELGVPLQMLDAVALLDLGSASLAGLDSVRDQSWLAGRQMPLKVIGPPGIETVARGLDLSREQADAIDAVALKSGMVRFDAAVMVPEIAAPMGAEPQRVFDTGDLVINSHDDGGGGLLLQVRYGDAIVVIAGASARRERVIAVANAADVLVLPGVLHDWLKQESRSALEGGQQRRALLAQRWIDFSPDAREQVFGLRALRPTQMLFWPLLPSVEQPVGELAWRATAIESTVSGVALARQGRPVAVAVRRADPTSTPDTPFSTGTDP